MFVSGDGDSEVSNGGAGGDTEVSYGSGGGCEFSDGCGGQVV